MTRIYKTAFAEIGDREALADTDPGTGKVSLPAGWTPDYEKENDDPNYRPVGRQEMNGILFEITRGLGEMQLYGFAQWQPVDGGWPVGANVNHGGGVWQSLANANTEEPGTGALWKPILFDNIGQANETNLGLVQIATTAEARAMTNDEHALTPAKLADSGAVFPGEVRAFAGPVANTPDGWLPCNGATISRTTYSRLFTVIGTTYGAGDGTTTFNIPDLRGEFIRGFDDGRGVDAGRAFGSGQNGEVEAHRHDMNIVATQNGTLADSGPGSLRGATSGLRRDTEGTPIQLTDTIALNDGAETRPRNIAMNYIIKY